MDEMFTQMCHAVIPAAGSGNRFGTDVPKQFYKVKGKEVLIHTLLKFVRCAFLQFIVIVLPEDNLGKDMVKTIKENSQFAKVLTVYGSTSRHRSILKGLYCLQKHIEEKWSLYKCQEHIAIIHDAVRPFIDEQNIVQIYQQTCAHRVAGMIIPLTSTVLLADKDGKLVKSLDRRTHFASEMPQGFVLSDIIQAYEKSTAEELDHGTECLEIVRKYLGINAKLIIGDANKLWKVTYEKDIPALEAYFSAS